MHPEAVPASHNILIVSGAKGDTRRYRTIHLHQQLQLMGLDSSLSHITNPNLPTLVKRADILILHRAPNDPLVAGIIETVHERRGLVLMDTDDLIFDPAAFDWIDSPDFRDPVRAGLYREDMRRHRQTLEACDAVLASTEYLAGRVRSAGKLCWVHRNAANLELVERSERVLKERRRIGQKIVVGYASGTPTHNRDFAVIAPVLQDLLGAHPEVELRIIGFLDLAPDWGRFRERIRRYNSVAWQDLPAWIAQLDINLAPLMESNPFSQSKSEIKYVEAALVGVPTIASRIGSYTEAIRDGQNGLLATSLPEWRACLERLMEVEFRTGLGTRALKDVSDRYSPVTRGQQAVDLLNEITRELERPFHWEKRPIAEERFKDLWWNPEIERRPTEIEMGLYTLRQRGLATLAKQIWIYFRRWLAKFIHYG